MADKIDEIEGIGEKYAATLAEAGIKTADDLLGRGGTPKGREDLATATGITEKLILKWVNHADLMRIKGIGGQYAELLEAAGVDTVKELRTRNAANLAAKVAEVNEAKNLTNRTPVESEIARWIEEAGTLEPRVSY